MTQTVFKLEICFEQPAVIWELIMKKTAAAIALLCASSSAMALPGLDLWAGGYTWNTSYEGTVAATASGQTLNLSVDDNLGLKDSDNNVLWAAFEHPIPFIPNVQIKKTDLETEGTGVFTETFVYAGQTYSASEELNSRMNLNHIDYTAYWGLPLPIVTFDLGLNVRKFEGELAINTGVEELDAPIPMVFGRVGAELPLTGLELMAEANYVGYKDTSHMDYQVVLRYTLPVLPVLDINLEAGYRSFQLDVDPTDFDGDADDLTADIDMSGVFLGLSLHL